MTTRMRELLEQAAGTPDVPVDLEAALRRGDQLRRRRQLAVGALASVLVVGAAGLAMQLPGDVVIPEVAGQDESGPSEPDDDDDVVADPQLEPQDLREVAVGWLDDGRPWTAEGADTVDYLCVRFSIADRELMDNCTLSSDRRDVIFVSHLADRPGGANVTVGYIGGGWHAPVEVEFQDATTTAADLHRIDGSPAHFFLAEYGEETPTHLVVHDGNGEAQRLELHP
jgi:hypothetical protein